MKNVILFLVLSFFAVKPLFGCLNYYYALDQEGHLHEITEMHASFKKFNKNFNTRLICKKLPELQEKIKTEGDYKDLSDYAVFLMKMGKFEEAKIILVELQYNHPDEYKLASNLGTAFELVGELDSALKYINYGMELNPDAHEGSEWVHIRCIGNKEKNASGLFLPCQPYSFGII